MATLDEAAKKAGVKEKEEGGVKGFVRAVGKPFLRAGLSALRAGQAIGGSVIAAGQAAFGDKEGAKETLAQFSSTDPVNIPFFGDITPVTTPRGVFGVGLETGAGVGGGKAGVTAVKTAGRGLIKQAAKTGAKEGAVIGAEGGLGIALSGEKDLSKSKAQRFGEAAVSTAIGATAGTAIGGGIPVARGIIRGAKDVLNLAGRLIRRTGKGVKAGAEFAGEQLNIQKSINDVASTIPKQPAKVVVRQVAEEVPIGVKVIKPEPKVKVAKPKEQPKVVVQEITEKQAQKTTRDALEAGVDEQVVRFVGTSGADDQILFKEMFDMATKRRADIRIQTQPKEVAGRVILQRAEHLIKSKNENGITLGKIIGDAPDTQLDVTNQFNEFAQEMSERGLRVSEDIIEDGKVIEKGGKVIQIVGSRIPSGDVKAYQLLHDLLKPNKSGVTSRTAKELNDIRKRVFAEFDLAKAQQKPFSVDVDTVAARYRTRLIEPIESVAKGYRETSTKIAKSFKALNDFVSLTTYKGSLDDLVAKDLRVGEVAGRVLGNAADRPTSIINQLEDTAIELGFEPKNNVYDVIQFGDILEAFFGNFQTRNLQGQVARGVNIPTGKADIAGKAIKAVLGQGDEAQIKALEDLLDLVVSGK